MSSTTGREKKNHGKKRKKKRGWATTISSFAERETSLLTPTERRSSEGRRKRGAQRPVDDAYSPKGERARSRSLERGVTTKKKKKEEGGKRTGSTTSPEKRKG